MRKTFTILTLITLLTSCSISKNKEEKAIKICQKAKFQSQNSFINIFGTNATWLDYANMIAKQDPNNKYNWHAEQTENNKYFVVDFTDTAGNGYHWEVDVEQQIVKSINDNDYLLKKYGFSSFRESD